MKKNKHQSIKHQAAKIARLTKAVRPATVTECSPSKPGKTRAITIPPVVGAEAATAAGSVAKLVVEFHNTDTGLSDFTATHNGQLQTIHESGTISFNVNTNDTIMISGNSTGSTMVKMNGVRAIPMQMNFDAGQHIGGLFLITS